MSNLINVNLVHQVQEDYLAYSLSVIVGRSIPRYTDGCKPISRRILTAMKWLNLKPDGSYMKSARVEGEVMGKLSPHGSSYSSIVTLAAPWSNMLPYVNGHGNWGDSTCHAASSRYTECKLSPFASDVLLDNSETWQVTDNYDGSLKEPMELDVKVPAVFLNGQEGIGVGLATKIPQHNLKEICDAVVKGTPLYPDFSTGCSIVRDQGLEDYVRTGAGSIRCRAVLEVDVIPKSGRKAERAKLTFTNLPISTNPEKIGEQIKSALERGRFDGVAEVVDESDMTGDRITVIGKPGVDGLRLSQHLYAHTDLDTKFSARTLVIDGTKPIELSPERLIEKWKLWRVSRLKSQFEHELTSKEERQEIILGLLKAISKIDLVIKVIRAAKTPKEAVVELVSNRILKFTSEQAKAILELKLRSLTNLDSDVLLSEKQNIEARIEELNSLIQDGKARTRHMLTEVKKISVRYGEKRRSEIIDIPESIEVKQSPLLGKSTVTKTRFVKVDSKRGVVEQVKGPKGAIALDSKEKLILMTEDGTLKKVPATYKGAISLGYSPVALSKRENEVSSRKFIAVFELEGQLKGMVLSGEDLCKTTSSGKRWLPDGSNLKYFGEDPYEITWVSTRKKPQRIDLTFKAGKPGGKGVKLADLSEVKLP
jgi:DNA gyrase subunit A